MHGLHQTLPAGLSALAESRDAAPATARQQGYLATFRRGPLTGPWFICPVKNRSCLSQQWQEHAWAHSRALRRMHRLAANRGAGAPCHRSRKCGIRSLSLEGDAASLRSARQCPACYCMTPTDSSAPGIRNCFGTARQWQFGQLPCFIDRLPDAANAKGVHERPQGPRCCDGCCGQRRLRAATA